MTTTRTDGNPEPLPQARRRVTDPQPMPKGRGAVIADLVIADIAQRKADGTAKYGEPLRAFNGREGLVDLYQELVDATQYVRQVIEEDRALPKLSDSELLTLLFVLTLYERQHGSNADSHIVRMAEQVVDVNAFNACSSLRLIDNITAQCIARGLKFLAADKQNGQPSPYSS